MNSMGTSETFYSKIPYTEAEKIVTDKCFASKTNRDRTFSSKE